MERDNEIAQPVLHTLHLRCNVMTRVKVCSKADAPGKPCLASELKPNLPTGRILLVLEPPLQGPADCCHHLRTNTGAKEATFCRQPENYILAYIRLIPQELNIALVLTITRSICECCFKKIHMLYLALESQGNAVHCHIQTFSFGVRHV